MLQQTEPSIDYSPGTSPAQPIVPTKIFTDPETFTLSFKGKSVFLGNTIVFKLAARLAQRPNIFYHFDNLKLEVWHDDLTSDPTISRTISRLRRKLNDAHFEGVELAIQKHHVGLMTQ